MRSTVSHGPSSRRNDAAYSATSRSITLPRTPRAGTAPSRRRSSTPRSVNACTSSIITDRERGPDGSRACCRRRSVRRRADAAAHGDRHHRTAGFLGEGLLRNALGDPSTATRSHGRSATVPRSSCPATGSRRSAPSSARRSALRSDDEAAVRKRTRANRRFLNAWEYLERRYGGRVTPGKKSHVLGVLNACSARSW